MVTSYAPRVRASNSEGVEWTQEQKDEYAQQWNNFARLMAKRVEGQSRDFDATVFEIGPPTVVKNTYKDAKTETRTIRTIRVQLSQEGVNMLRFYGDSADNPFNDKTLLNKLLLACGYKPVESEGLTIDFNTLIGRKVRVTITKQGQRTDGKRGGFWTKLDNITPVFDDDDEVVVTAPKAPTATPTKTAKPNTGAATSQTATGADDDYDDVPF